MLSLVLPETCAGQCITSCSRCLYFTIWRRGRSIAPIDSLLLLAGVTFFGEHLLLSASVTLASSITVVETRVEESIMRRWSYDQKKIHQIEKRGVSGCQQLNCFWPLHLASQSVLLYAVCFLPLPIVRWPNRKSLQRRVRISSSIPCPIMRCEHLPVICSSKIRKEGEEKNDLLYTWQNNSRVHTKSERCCQEGAQGCCNGYD